MIFADQPDADRQLGVKAPALLARGLEQLLLKARTQARLRNVHQQIRHLGLAGQLPQHGAEAALHLPELRLVRVEVRRTLLFVLELAAQIQFVRLRLLQDGPVVVPDEHVPGEGRTDDENQEHEEAAHGQRPAADVARIESTKLVDEIHFAATFLTVVWPPSSRFTPTVSANNVKLEPPVGEFAADSTTCSCGLSIHTDASMFRMNVDTRVLDCATPCISSLLPISFSCVRSTPSRTIFTRSSNRCTISGRLRCSRSMISMRATRRCLRLSRS